MMNVDPSYKAVPFSRSPGYFRQLFFTVRDAQLRRTRIALINIMLRLLLCKLKNTFNVLFKAVLAIPGNALVSLFCILVHIGKRTRSNFLKCKIVAIAFKVFEFSDLFFKLRVFVLQKDQSLLRVEYGLLKINDTLVGRRNILMARLRYGFELTDQLSQTLDASEGLVNDLNRAWNIDHLIEKQQVNEKSYSATGRSDIQPRENHD